MTPIPLSIIQVIQSDTPEDYDRKETGFSISVGSCIAKNLNVPHYEWHKAYTSIERLEMIHHASKALATIYKSELNLKVESSVQDKISN